MSSGIRFLSIWFYLLVFISSVSATGFSQEEFSTPSGKVLKSARWTAQAGYRCYRKPDRDGDRENGNILLWPTAGTVGKGHFSVEIGRATILGMGYGVTDCFSFSIGFSPLLTVQAEAKYSIIKTREHVFSLMGFIHYPYFVGLYSFEDDRDFMDVGFVYAGGILYKYEGRVYEFSSGVIFLGMPVADEYDACDANGGCHEKKDWYHKYVILTPYIEAGVRASRKWKFFLIFSHYQIRSVRFKKWSERGEFRKDKEVIHYWKNLIITPGARFFRSRFVLDAGLVIPLTAHTVRGNFFAVPLIGISILI